MQQEVESIRELKIIIFNGYTWHFVNMQQEVESIRELKIKIFNGYTWHLTHYNCRCTEFIVIVSM